MHPNGLTALILLALPSLASAQHYSAEPAAAPPAARLVVKDVMWNCTATGCTGTQSNSRPAIVCASLARKVGALRSFRSAGTPLTPAALDACNARAK